MPWIVLAILWTPIMVLVFVVSTEYMWVVLCGLTPLTIAVALTTVSRILATRKSLARRTP